MMLSLRRLAGQLALRLLLPVPAYAASASVLAGVFSTAIKCPTLVLPRDVRPTETIEEGWVLWGWDSVKGLTSSTPYQARTVIPVGGGGGAFFSLSSPVISMAMRKNLMANGMSRAVNAVSPAWST